MIITKDERTLIKSATEESADYFIDKDNVAQIGLVLQGMYSDPVLAMIREYVANAVDAHVQAGKANVPVIVRLPTAFSPQFEVEDQGPGLSVPDTRRLLLGYGASGEHKRKSDDYIGGFGIGCKCALATVDQFTYTIWHDGMVRIWNSYKDEHGHSKADKVFEAPTTHPNGVKVSIPVPESMFTQFQQRVQDALRYFDVTPTVENLDANRVINVFKPLPDVEIPSAFGSVIRFNSETENPNSTCVLVMGGVGYPVNLDKVFDGQMREDQRVLTHRMVIYAPVGTVQPAPSREALQYTQHTRKRMQTITHPFGPEALEDTLTKILNGIPNTVQKITTWTSLMQYIGRSRLLLKVADTLEKRTPWLSRSGLKLHTMTIAKTAHDTIPYGILSLSRVSTYQQYRPDGTTLGAYTYSIRTDTMGTVEDGGWHREVTVDCDELRILVLDDARPAISTDDLIYSAWKNEGFEDGTRSTHLFFMTVKKSRLGDLLREYPWITEYHQAYPRTMVDVDNWLCAHPDGVLIREDALLNNDRKWRVKTARLNRRQGGTGSTRSKIATHSVKLVKMKRGVKHVSKSSDFWEPAAIAKAELVGKPYVIIDKFEITRGQCFDQGYCNTSNVVEYLLPDYCLALKDTPLYGIRVRDKDNVYGMVPLDRYLLDWLKKEWPKLTDAEKNLARSLAHQLPTRASNTFSKEEWFWELITQKAFQKSCSDLNLFGYARFNELSDALDLVMRSFGEHDPTPELDYCIAGQQLTRQITHGEDTVLNKHAAKIITPVLIMTAFRLMDNVSDSDVEYDNTKEARKLLGVSEWHSTPKALRHKWYLDAVEKTVQTVPRLMDVVRMQLPYLASEHGTAAQRLTEALLPHKKKRQKQ